MFLYFYICILNLIPNLWNVNEEKFNYHLSFRGLRVIRLEDTNFDKSPVFALFFILLPDPQGQTDIIEDVRPLAGEFPLLQVDQRGDDLPLTAVEVFLVQQLHHGLPHGVAGAGGGGALAGGGRGGPGRCRDLGWGGD